MISLRQKLNRKVKGPEQSGEQSILVDSETVCRTKDQTIGRWMDPISAASAVARTGSGSVGHSDEGVGLYDEREWFIVSSGIGHQSAVYLPKRPWISRDDRGKHAFALTLQLSRQTLPHEDSFGELIELGFLTMDLTLALPATGTSRFDASTQLSLPEPAFATSVEFRIRPRGGSAFACTAGCGPGAPALLTAALDKENARRVLAAMESDSSDLELEADVVLTTGLRSVDVFVRCSWGDLHDAILEAADGERIVDLNVIERALNAVRLTGRCLVECNGNAATHREWENALAGPLLRRMLCHADPLLKCLPATSTHFYLVKEKPEGTAFWELRERITTPVFERFQLKCGFNQLLRDIRIEGRIKDYIHVVSKGGLLSSAGSSHDEASYQLSGNVIEKESGTCSPAGGEVTSRISVLEVRSEKPIKLDVQKSNQMLGERIARTQPLKRTDFQSCGALVRRIAAGGRLCGSYFGPLLPIRILTP